MMRIQGRGRETGHSAEFGRRQFLRDAGLTVAAGWILLKPASAGAGPVTTDRYGDQVQTVRRGEMPEFARELPDVGRVYRFATDRAADLGYIPCFCGCKNIGHRSNRDCYIKSLNRDGTITYTSHGAT